MVAMYSNFVKSLQFRRVKLSMWTTEMAAEWPGKTISASVTKIGSILFAIEFLKRFKAPNQPQKRPVGRPRAVSTLAAAQSPSPYVHSFL